MDVALPVPVDGAECTSPYQREEACDPTTESGAGRTQVVARIFRCATTLPAANADVTAYRVRNRSSFEYLSHSDLLIAGGRGPTVLISTIDGRHRKISSNLEAILKEQRYVSVLDGVDHSARMGARDLYFDASAGALYLSYVVRSEAGEDCFGLGILRAEIRGDLWDSDFGIQWVPFWATEACVQNANTHAAGGRM